MTIHHSSNGTHYYILAENNHFLHSDLIIRSTTTPFETGRYSSIKDAQEVIDAYASSHQPQEKVYKLLEPRLSVDKTDKWLVPTTESHRYLFSNGKIDRHLLVSDPLAYFSSYQSALFAKLHYERLNREK